MSDRSFLPAMFEPSNPAMLIVRARALAPRFALPYPTERCERNSNLMPTTSSY